MEVEQKIEIIRKYLRKNAEKNIIDLIIKDYNDTNFYMTLLFNSRLEKFKVLFIPLDIMESKKVEDYACYQFIQIPLVNYILETIHDSKNVYLDEEFRNRKKNNVDSYYIEINTHVGGEDYSFKTTQYIPKEWLFLYEIISLLFQHVPSIVSELGNELLSILNGEEVVEYTRSVRFDLFNDEVSSLFKEKQKDKIEVSFLEKINDKYYVIVNNHIVIVDYNSRKKILNLYCDVDDDSYYYIALSKIVSKFEKEFYKLIVASCLDDFQNNKVKYYLCCGVDNFGLNIIKNTKFEKISLEKVMNGLVKIDKESSGGLVDDLEKYLNEMYEKQKVTDVIENIFEVISK